ncbi:MAG: phage major capsid protein [Nitrososphaerales archaeon]
METVLIESFQWAEQLWPIVKQYSEDEVNFYRVIASNADIKNRNGRVYTSEELSRAASSLSERPLNINHDTKRQLEFPENEVLIARFEDGRVEAIIQVADKATQQMIDSGEIATVSIEGFYLDSSKNTTSTEYPTSLHFRALALLTREDQPGDPLAQIIKESVSIPGIISEHLVREAAWSASFVADLPDDSFAYVDSGGKDEQGKTTPRSLRHFPYKDASGKIDPDHVKDALAKLPETAISPQAKGAARKRLEDAAKQVGIGVSSTEEKSVELALKIEDAIPEPAPPTQSTPKTPAKVEEEIIITVSTTEEPVTQSPVASSPPQSLTISESEKIAMSQVEQPVTKPSEQTQPAIPVKESVPINVSVKLEGVEDFKQGVQQMAQSLKELLPAPKPSAKISATEAGQRVEEGAEVKERARLDTVAAVLRRMANVREDISSSVAAGALGQVWSPDMIILPPDLPANLRRFVQVKEIPRGSKQVNFTTITTPAFAALTEDTAPLDVTQTITEIAVTPSETGAKQRISYVTMESATPDIVQAVERSFQAAALIDEDNTILAACDGATPAATLYGDETVTAESSITSAMVFKGARLASALREIQKKGYAMNPGDAVAVLHPVQYDALLKDTAISQYLYFGSAGPIQQGVVPQVYGVDVVRSTKIPLGTGSGSPAITTYHAQVFLKAQAKGSPQGLGIGGSVALAVSRELMVELWRKVDERALYLVASHRISSAVLQPNALVHIYSA